MYIKTDNKEIGAKLAAHYQAGKPIEIMGKLFFGNSIGFEYPDSCFEFHGSEVSKVAWTGEGLPPVGTVCEVLNNELSGPEWERCTILYSGKFRIMYDSESCYERVGFIDNLKFRQIRTPDQIAAEKREADIEELRMLLSKVACDDYHAAVAMIDAGYHK